MTKIKFSTLALLAAFALSFTACDNEDDTPAVQEGTVNMMFEYTIDGAAFDTTQVYDVNGTAVKFSIANFYVGGIELMPEEGDAIPVAGKYLLVTPEAGMQEVTTVPAGHYHMVNFFVGVDPTNNSQSEGDFTSRNADDPLSIQFPAMHWNWNSGYRFLRIDGQVDTDGDGEVDESMAFHLGTANMLQNVSVTAHKDVEDGSNMLHLQFDLAKLFEGIDLSTDYSTHTMNNPELAAAVRDNIAGAFSMMH
ncbi:MAG: hypothetical protein RIC19_16520 [Phaeodactylibacter sp.]|uniref:MbnP family protein n=1 Tax=Phaeodactylibacter sp. TaxID=1940289 RepID=UPI0032EE835D